ncbi:hypothetical protein [Chamaesiphon sp. VAR_48_metabat_403]|uniref:hypothetical protein n=1 Tax=Chamaesiphon sp. VAR_48_metabat_403 TaxID=2964700 RepID=UPI00286D6C9C|nr:hypothetical protein [Chamaesiphon sp. VAR_48_metabat_403]
MNHLWQLFLPPILLADMSLVPILIVGGAVAIFSSLGVLTIEAIVFYRGGWTWGKAFLDSFLLNLASTVAGYVLYPIVGGVIIVLTENIKVAAQIEQILGYLLWGIAFILAFVGTVAIEYYVLILLRGKEDRARFKRSVVIANLWSYGATLILGLTIYLFFMRG